MPMPPTPADDARNQALPPAGPVAPFPAPGVLPPPEAQAESFSIGRMIRALRHRWLVALILGTAAAGTAFVATWVLMPPRFVSTAQLEVPSESYYLVFDVAKTKTYQTFIKGQEETLKGDLVLSSASRDPSVADLPSIREVGDPVRWLRSRLNVKFSGEIMLVTFDGPSEDEAQTVLNAIINAYTKTQREIEKDWYIKNIELTQEALTTYKGMQAEKQAALEKLAETTGSTEDTGIQFRQIFELDTLHQAQQSLNDINGRIRRATIDLKLAQARQGHQPPPTNNRAPARGSSKLNDQTKRSIADEILRNDKGAADRQDRISSLQRGLDEVRRLSRNGNDPTSMRIQMQLKDARADYDDYVKNIEGSVRDEIQRRAEEGVIAASPSGGTPRESEAEAIRKELASLMEEEAVLRKQVETYSEQAAQLAAKSYEVSKLKEDLTITDNVTRQIAQRLEQLKVEVNAPPRVNVMTPASPGDLKGSMDRKFKFSWAASAGALVGALILVSLLEMRTRRIYSPELLGVELDAKVIGVVPAVPPKVEARGLLIRDDPQHAFWNGVLKETMNSIRVQVLHAASRRNARVVMVTSAMAREGKTSLSVNLAESMGRSGFRTLLIDCDLRRPMIATLFQAEPAPGVSEIMDGAVEPMTAVRATKMPNLWLMTAGDCDPETIEDLTHGKLARVVTPLRQRFDFIVIDSAPLLPVSDTMIVGQVADAAIFVTMRNRSRIDRVKAAYDRLRDFNIPLLGTIVTATTLRGGTSYGSGGYGYGYGYGSYGGYGGYGRRGSRESTRKAHRQRPGEGNNGEQQEAMASNHGSNGEANGHA